MRSQVGEVLQHVGRHLRHTVFGLPAPVAPGNRIVDGIRPTGRDGLAEIRRIRHLERWTMPADLGRQLLGRKAHACEVVAAALADALGRPLRFIVTAGQVNDITQSPALLDGQSGDAVLADKAYDSNALRAIIAEIGATAVIPSNRTRRIIIPHDTDAYKL